MRLVSTIFAHRLFDPGLDAFEQLLCSTTSDRSFKNCRSRSRETSGRTLTSSASSDSWLYVGPASQRQEWLTVVVILEIVL